MPGITSIVNGCDCEDCGEYRKVFKEIAMKVEAVRQKAVDGDDGEIAAFANCFFSVFHALGTGEFGLIPIRAELASALEIIRSLDARDTMKRALLDGLEMLSDATVSIGDDPEDLLDKLPPEAITHLLKKLPPVLADQLRKAIKAREDKTS